jgi:archaellum component FlaF (FlaF/FlaG flagellin family)
MKKLLTLILLLTSIIVNAQSTEWYSEAYPTYRSNQKIVRTDQTGNVVWKKEISEITNDDCSVYIIASSTVIKGGKIVSNPSDYDYWLITESLMNDSMIVCPTLCTDHTTIFIGGTYPRDMFLDIYNQEGRLVKLKRLNLSDNLVYFQDLPNGIYYLTIGTEIGTEEKTFKIVIHK